MQVLEYKDVVGWSAKEVDAKISEIRKSLFDLRMQRTTSGIEKPHQVKVAKKNIAKLLTVKNAKGE